LEEAVVDNLSDTKPRESGFFCANFMKEGEKI